MFFKFITGLSISTESLAMACLTSEIACFVEDKAVVVLSVVSAPGKLDFVNSDGCPADAVIIGGLGVGIFFFMFNIHILIFYFLT